MSNPKSVYAQWKEITLKSCRSLILIAVLAICLLYPSDSKGSNRSLRLELRRRAPREVTERRRPARATAAREDILGRNMLRLASSEETIRRELDFYMNPKRLTVLNAVSNDTQKTINTLLNSYAQTPNKTIIEDIIKKGNISPDDRSMAEYYSYLASRLFLMKKHDIDTIQLTNHSIRQLLELEVDLAKSVCSTEAYIQFCYNMSDELKVPFLKDLNKDFNYYDDTRKRFSKYIKDYTEYRDSQNTSEMRMDMITVCPLSKYQHTQTKHRYTSPSFWDDYLYSRGIHPSLDPSRNWDWTKHDWFTSRSISSPFVSSNHTGVDVTTDHCQPEDGWVLFIRKIMNTDTENTTEDTCMELRAGQKYFSLYNRYTGILRTFIYHQDANFNSGDYFRVIMEVSEGNQENPYAKHGLFNIAGAVSYSNEEINGMSTNQIEYYCNYITRGWIVVDIPLSYYKFAGDGPYYLNYFVNSVDKATITLDGTFDLKSGDYIDENPDITTGVSNLSGHIKHVTNTKNNIQGVGEDLTRIGGELQGGLNDSLGNSLVNLGNAITSITSPFDVVFEGFQFLASFFDFGGSSPVTYSYYKGTINLSGTISNKAPEGFISLLIEPNFDVERADFPFFFKKYFFVKLGLFNAKNLPYIKIVTDTFEVQDMSPGYQRALGVRVTDLINIVINPAIKAELKHYKIQPVIQRWKPLDDNYTSHEYARFNPAFIKTEDPAKPDHYTLIFVPTFMSTSYYDFQEIYHCMTAGFTNLTDETGDELSWWEQNATGAYMRVNYKFEVTKDDLTILPINLYTTYISKYKYESYDWVGRFYWE